MIEQQLIQQETARQQQTFFGGQTFSEFVVTVSVIAVIVLLVVWLVLRFKSNWLTVDVGQAEADPKLEADLRSLQSQQNRLWEKWTEAEVKAREAEDKAQKAEARVLEETRKREIAEAKLAVLEEQIRQLRDELERKNVIDKPPMPKPPLNVLAVWSSGPGLDPGGNAKALSQAGVQYNALSGDKASMEQIVYELDRGRYNTIEVGGLGNADGIQLLDGMATGEFWAGICTMYGIKLFLALADNSTGTNQRSIADQVFDVSSIDAVVAVQGAVPDEVARRWARMFYARSNRGSSLKEATLAAGFTVMEHKQLFVLREKKSGGA